MRAGIHRGRSLSSTRSVAFRQNSPLEGGALPQGQSSQADDAPLQTRAPRAGCSSRLPATAAGWPAIRHYLLFGGVALLAAAGATLSPDGAEATTFDETEDFGDSFSAPKSVSTNSFMISSVWRWKGTGFG